MANNQPEQRLNGMAQLLVKESLLGKEEGLRYQQLALKNNERFPTFLVKNHIISALALAHILSKYFGLPFLDLDSIDIDPKALEVVNETLMCRHQVIPISLNKQCLILATDDPENQNGFKEIQFHTGLTLKLNIVETDKLKACLDSLFNKNKNLTLSANDEDRPIVEFLNEILDGAILKCASDIHFEPYELEYRIRYRLDGLLSEIVKPPPHLANRIGARIKIMANLDISERRKPQDGGFQFQTPTNQKVDCRVSTCPTVHGEKIVIRVFDRNFTQLDLNTLGLNSGQKKHFLDNIFKPQGLILVTGPTGSGKTLTLYTALNLLNSNERNISTAEDPVEIKIPGINQVNMSPKTGLTFSTILRTFLRQDPDIIMVGEIRDEETAKLAIKAAHTGHLVFSTLHTNSAAETLLRLSNLGIEPEVSSPFFEQIIIERKSKKEVTSMSEHDLIGFLRFNRQG